MDDLGVGADLANSLDLSMPDDAAANPDLPPPPDLAPPPPKLFSFDVAPAYSVGHNPFSTVSGDFDGDGKPDIAALARTDNAVSVLINKGNGTFKPAATYSTGMAPSGIVAADFNGDGKAEIATTGGNG